MNSAIKPQSTEDITSTDVAVIGGGLSGLAASVGLSRRGFRVTCFEPVTDFSHVVGESLDWSAPELFDELESPMEDLIRREVSTFKRHVILKLPDDSATEYIPSPWLGHPPLNIELRTIHVDRMRLQRDLQRIAIKNGVSIIHDRVTDVECEGRTITGLRTALGRRVASRWFLDASGAAVSKLGRLFRLPVVEYGPRKVAMWTYLEVAERHEGMTLYAMAAKRQYMNWVWEIPIRPGIISVGCVSTGEEIKRERAHGLTIDEIFRRQLLNFSRFQALLHRSELPTPNVTAFTCRVFRHVCGPNWIIIGEAASLLDPITGNGVTAALSHAAEASRLIERFKRKGKISILARAVYGLRVFQMGEFFNSLIEKLAYSWPIRDRMGLVAAGNAYTIPAWSINHLYSRLGPNGAISTVLFCLFLKSLQGVVWIFYHLCRLLPPSRPRVAEVQS